MRPPSDISRNPPALLARLRARRCYTARARRGHTLPRASKSRSWWATVNPCRRAHAAIRQSTPDRMVTPARRAARYNWIASWKTSSRRGDSTIGNASIASRAMRNARSSRKPWSTSCTTGRQVTISSMSATDSRLRTPGLRNTSTHTEVSTRTTHLSPGALNRMIVSHLGEVPLPEPGPRQLENPVGSRAPHEFTQRPGDRGRIGPLPAELDNLVQQRLV
jgi:hypothetical protein